MGAFFTLGSGNKVGEGFDATFKHWVLVDDVFWMRQKPSLPR